MQLSCEELDKFRVEAESGSKASARSGHSQGGHRAQRQVEGVEDGVDQVNLGSAKGSQKSELGVEEGSKESSKQLGHNDGSKDGEEEGGQLKNFVQVEEILLLRCSILGGVIAGHSVLLGSCGGVVSRGGGIPVVGSCVPLVRCKITVIGEHSSDKADSED